MMRWLLGGMGGRREIEGFYGRGRGGLVVVVGDRDCGKGGVGGRGWGWGVWGIFEYAPRWRKRKTAI